MKIVLMGKREIMSCTDADLLLHERKATEDAINELWKDTAFQLTRDRYDVHDLYIKTIRRINERLGELQS